MEKLQEMLATALKMEEKGYKFYSEIVPKINDQVGKTLFTMLRDDELIHIERIKEIYGKLTASTDWNITLENLPSQKDQGLASLLRNLATKHREGINSDSDEMKALEVGIEFEAGAVAYYQKHLENATEENEKQFIQRMIEEEKEHHAVLVDMQSFYTDPAAWFVEHEHPHLD
ncbi:ferritin family protein [Myxococcota bacterium]|nr:ferritin family protein [Myxococcota bacterium]MBU1383213.1 ferritin family protein [Myxococcota bacterium]MBU1499165.1 ferritin family protein [Myxococcota bacterium]